MVARLNVNGRDTELLKLATQNDYSKENKPVYK